jgi:hypothetical protein
MGTVEVYSAVRRNCTIAGQTFRDGVAEVDEDAVGALALFRRRAEYSIGKPVEPATPAPPAEDEEESVTPAEMPPKTGPGSGHEEWEAYADSLGVEHDGMHRAEIIAAVEAHLVGDDASGDDDGDEDGDSADDADADEGDDGEE